MNYSVEGNPTGFQEAMAWILRTPERFHKDPEKFLSQYQLNEHEAKQIITMSEDRHVRKYAFLMQLLRRKECTQEMPMASAYLTEDMLDKMFAIFDDKSQLVPQEDNAFRFMEAVLIDEELIPFTQGAPSFMRDLLAYEVTRARLDRTDMVYDNPEIPGDSLLRHNAFEILEFSHDIPRYAQLIDKGQTGMIPEAKDVKVLFLRCEGFPSQRVFAIDDQLAGFLKGQLQAGNSETELPPCYATLVSLKLTKPLN